MNPRTGFQFGARAWVLCLPGIVPLLRTSLAVLLLSGCMSAAVARLLLYPRPVPYELTQRAAAIQSADDLRAALQDDNGTLRVLAARRAAEIGGAGVIAELEQAVMAPYGRPRRYAGGFREAAVSSIAQIGGNEAREALLRILATYTEAGPGDVKHIYDNGVYTSVVESTINALGEWAYDAEVLALLEQIAFHGDEHTYDWLMRQTAYAELLEHEMAEAGLITLEQRAEFLLGRLTRPGQGHPDDWVEGKEGVKTLDALRNGAIVGLLEFYGKDAEPFIQQQLDNAGERPEEYRKALRNILRSIDLVLERDQRTACMTAMLAVGQALLAYAAEHDGFLPSASDWQEAIAPHLTEDARLTCPATLDRSVVYYHMNPVLSGELVDDPARRWSEQPILLYEGDSDGRPVLPHQGGGLGFCVRLDGQLGTLNPQTIQELDVPGNGP